MIIKNGFCVLQVCKFVGKSWIKRDSKTKWDMSPRDPIKTIVKQMTTEICSQPSLHDS